MVRGRKKDLTVPLTRQLVLQRDYRARKARYLSELEQRCSRAEQENARLRMELELARAAIPFASPHEVARVSSELLRDLANASASVVRFQEVIAPRASTSSPHPEPFHRQQPSIPTYSRPLSGYTGLSSLPCQAPPQPITHPSPQTSPVNELAARSTLPHRILSPIQGQSDDRTPTMSPQDSPQPSRTGSPLGRESECCGGYVDCSSECCGGYFDCGELMEEQDDPRHVKENKDSGRNSPNTSRT